MSVEIGDLTTRIENIELNSSKKMVIMTGYTVVYQKKADVLQELNEFLDHAMGLQICVDDYFLLGAVSPKPVVLVLQTMEDKRTILRNKQQLSELRDVSGRKIFINDYLPQAAQEKKRRDQQILDEMENLGKQDDVTYFKGNLAIDGQVYQKKVLPPTPKQLIDLEPKELDALLRLKTRKGNQYSHSNSKFISYCAEVKTHDQINQLYVKIKMIKPDARHVACAYSIQYDEVQYTKDFHDDGEPGVGRMLLDLMEQKQLKNIVVFATRVYGGIRMGAERFSCYMKATKTCLGLNPDEEVEKPLKRKPNMRGRGNNVLSTTLQGVQHREIEVLTEDLREIRIREEQLETGLCREDP